MSITITSINIRPIIIFFIVVSVLLSILSRVLIFVAQHFFLQRPNTAQRLASLARVFNALPSMVFRVVNIRNFIFLFLFIILAEYLNFDIAALKDFVSEVVGALNDIIGFFIGFVY